MLYNILDLKRLKILPLLKKFKKDFYLGGDTALALQLGHRDSVDFDFFSKKDIDTQELFEDLRLVFKEHKILKTQQEYNTLTVLISDSIKLSFFTYKYKLINKTINEKNIRLASIEDIGCMKLSAITGRASNKDYIDIYYILQNVELKDLLKKASKKFPELDSNLILKSLIYFQDISMQPINFKNDNYVEFKEVKSLLKQEVKKITQV